MSYIRLKTPEGYFEKSLKRTFASVEGIRKRRRAVLCTCIAVVLAGGTYFSISTLRSNEGEKEYLALQEELARLDIFLEINE